MAGHDDVILKEAEPDQHTKAEMHFGKMDARSDWDKLHAAVESKWGRKFGVHTENLTHGDWGSACHWLKGKSFKIAQTMLHSAGGYFPSKAEQIEVDSSIRKNITSNSGIEFVVHSPYVIQIAGLSKTRKVSAKSLKVQCTIAASYGMKRVVVHASSPKVGSAYEGDSEQEVFAAWHQAVAQANEAAPNVQILIENPAWRNTWFSDPAKLAEMVRKLREQKCNVGMCYDSAHHWAAMKTFEIPAIQACADVVGLIHYNDCPGEAFSGKDSHSYTPMGTGKLGAENLASVLKAFPGVDCILERASYYDQDLEYIAKL